MKEGSCAHVGVFSYSTFDWSRILNYDYFYHLFNYGYLSTLKYPIGLQQPLVLSGTKYYTSLLLLVRDWVVCRFYIITSPTHQWSPSLPFMLWGEGKNWKEQIKQIKGKEEWKLILQSRYSIFKNRVVVNRTFTSNP